MLSAAPITVPPSLYPLRKSLWPAPAWLWPVALAVLLAPSLDSRAAAQPPAQPPLGFLERFALAEDRRQTLEELIPGSEDYFYYHALHFQNTNQLAESRQMLEAWRTKLGDTPAVANMFARQHLLEYAANPQQTLAYLRRELGLQLNHAPPARDPAASLPTQLDNRQLEFEAVLAGVLAADRSLSGVETSALPKLLDQQLSVDQLRALLGRLDRSDSPLLVRRIAEELQLKDSAGFGWAAVHDLLTLAQLLELQQLVPAVLENDRFVRAVTSRMAPPEGSSLADPAVLRSYVQRLYDWVKTLPPSQSSLKALVLGNWLRLDMSQGEYRRELFLEYLQLPRRADYYAPQRLSASKLPLADLAYQLTPHVPLPPVGDDSALVQRYLEHFLQAAANVDPFAAYIRRETLERIWAETNILYGLGAAATWYAKLTPSQQQELRERVELRFAPHNPQLFTSQDQVRLQVELKNVDQLLVKIYEINLLNYHRQHTQPPGTDIDLDGLVPNHQRQLTYAHPAERRHTEEFEFPECRGRGTWVIDLLGSGQRCRAVIHKGRLLAIERLGDAGHVLEIVDENGAPVPTAHVELDGRIFGPPAAEASAATPPGQNSPLAIIVPYAEQTVRRTLLLVDGQFASPLTITHHREEYALQANFWIDRQSLVAGRQAAVVIRARLACNGRPVSLSLLEQAQLSLIATDADGIATSHTEQELELRDGHEWVHRFWVPPRLTRLQLTLSGRVTNRSRDQQQTVQAQYTQHCNAIQQTPQIGDFYLRQTSDGYQLLVLGRNGEPLGRLPVSLQAKLQHFSRQKTFSVATDAQGQIELGRLEDVEQLEAAAAELQSANFQIRRVHRQWPAVVHLGREESLQLPLGQATADRSQFSLLELRRSTFSHNHADQLQLGEGRLAIAGLPAGDFLLQDHVTGQRVRIVVADAERRQQALAAPQRLLQASPTRPVIIRRAEFTDGELVVQVDGSDPQTRLHVLGTPLVPDSLASGALGLPDVPLMARSLAVNLSHYIDSLRLDEEYSYILDRQLAKQYPGNPLPQPSLLVAPWEVSVTENQEQAAAAGDALPPTAATPEPQAPPAGEAEGLDRGDRAAWQCYDFLANGSLLIANIPLTDGQARISLEDLPGMSSVSLVVVHPLSSDVRQLARDAGPLDRRDLRLKRAFEPEQQLAQVQKVEHLVAGQKLNLGDPRTRRTQAYASLADVFQLYGSLLNHPEWEKFRFLVQWHALTAQQQQAKYNEMACHEVNLFLYFKDRPFFDRVIEPLLANKLDKQLVDLWLLDKPLEEYLPLSRMQRLNALERVLLATRIASQQAGTQRWMRESLEAFPLPPDLRQRRFEIALLNLAINAPFGEQAELSYYFRSANGQAAGAAEFGMAGGYGAMAGGYGGMGGRVGAEAAAARPGNRPQPARDMRRGEKAERKAQAGLDAAATNDFFAVDRLGRALAEEQLFRSLDKTRQWAESQYYQVRWQDQSPDLVAPNAFWEEFLQAGGQEFLPRNLDLPAQSLSEALCALAVIDLPLPAPELQMVVEDDQLVVSSPSAAVVYVESIDRLPAAASEATVLIGQDVYVAQSGSQAEDQAPLGDAPLLTGVAYRAHVVVTNPSNRVQRVDLLTQLPAGSLPLAGSKLTRSIPLQLQPYTTAQSAYVFYFPAAGEFEHYGAQVGAAERHVASTPSRTYRVSEEPPQVDQSTWRYVADWGTDQQVLAYLQSSNLQQLDLTRIAFRMRDRNFYEAVINLLTSCGLFEPQLWAYAVLHDDASQIRQLLLNHPEFVQRLGKGLDSPLLQLDPHEHAGYEHLEYRPLVTARSHQLGRQRVILNPSLHQQYMQLLNNVAHRPAPSAEHRLQLCYYLLLQNRITESLEWFASVERDSLSTHMQYDYFDAYLDFYRGQYARAAAIAARYAEYPLPRWAELFGRISTQVADRQRSLEQVAGAAETPTTDAPPGEDAQQLLTDRRGQQQAAMAERLPALDVEILSGRVNLRHRNLDQVVVNYYLMDIELLFSRNPFASQASEEVPPIRPNLSQTVELQANSGTTWLELPADMQNRNVLLEVTAAGMSRSVWLTASDLTLSLTAAVGQLQVTQRRGGLPVEGAYVKVFSRRQDGSVHFYKDGYTDLNGNFDYASLSTGDLEDTQRLAILVLHGQLGAVVKEAAPPPR